MPNLTEREWEQLMDSESTPSNIRDFYRRNRSQVAQWSNRGNGRRGGAAADGRPNRAQLDRYRLRQNQYQELLQDGAGASTEADDDYFDLSDCPSPAPDVPSPSPFNAPLNYLRPGQHFKGSQYVSHANNGNSSQSNTTGNSEAWKCLE